MTQREVHSMFHSNSHTKPFVHVNLTTSNMSNIVVAKRPQQSVKAKDCGYVNGIVGSNLLFLQRKHSDSISSHSNERCPCSKKRCPYRSEAMISPRESQSGWIDVMIDQSTGRMGSNDRLIIKVFFV